MPLGVGFEISEAQRHSPFLLRADLDVEPSAPCLPTCHPDNGINLRNCKQASIKCFPMEELPWAWSLFSAIEY